MQKELPKRKSTRLRGYDYSSVGYYFITICVDLKCEIALGEIINNQSELNEYGVIVKNEIENITAIRKECVVKNYVIMPNHIHIIVQIVGDDGNRPADNHRADCRNHRADCHPPLRKSIPNMVQGFKGAVTRQIGFSIWQRSYHDRIIRDEEEYIRIWRYIDENPLNWDNDEYCVGGGLG